MRQKVYKWIHLHIEADRASQHLALFWDQRWLIADTTPLEEAKQLEILSFRWLIRGLATFCWKVVEAKTSASQDLDLRSWLFRQLSSGNTGKNVWWTKGWDPREGFNSSFRVECCQGCWLCLTDNSLIHRSQPVGSLLS